MKWGWIVISILLILAVIAYMIGINHLAEEMQNIPRMPRLD